MSADPSVMSKVKKNPIKKNTNLGPSPSTAHQKPPRFVLAVPGNEPSGFDPTLLGEQPYTFVWCIAVRAADAERVRDLQSDAKLDPREVLDWFPAGHRPQLNAATFESFLRVLRTLMVTLHATDRSDKAAQVKGAIETLVRLLPDFVGGWLASPGAGGYSFNDVKRLLALAEAAEDADGIIKGHNMPHKFQPWHNDAMIIEWHVRALLAEAGMGKARASHAVAAVTKIVQTALKITSGAPSPPEQPAIRQAVDRRMGETECLMTAEEVARHGYIVVA